MFAFKTPIKLRREAVPPSSISPEVRKKMGETVTEISAFEIKTGLLRHKIGNYCGADVCEAVQTRKNIEKNCEQAKVAAN